MFFVVLSVVDVVHCVYDGWLVFQAACGTVVANLLASTSCWKKKRRKEEELTRDCDRDALCSVAKRRMYDACAKWNV